MGKQGATGAQWAQAAKDIASVAGPLPSTRLMGGGRSHAGKSGTAHRDINGKPLHGHLDLPDELLNSILPLRDVVRQHQFAIFVEHHLPHIGRQIGESLASRLRILGSRTLLNVRIQGLHILEDEARKFSGILQQGEDE
eukprot:scaffold73305_cov29-Tisochrysis_lutea.AAC.2